MFRGKGREGWMCRSSFLLFCQLPLCTSFPQHKTLLFCEQGFGILGSSLPDKTRVGSAMKQGKHRKVSKLLCRCWSCKAEEEAGPQSSNPLAFSMVIGNPRCVYSSPWLAQPLSRTRLECALAPTPLLPKLEVTFW